MINQKMFIKHMKDILNKSMYYIKLFQTDLSDRTSISAKLSESNKILQDQIEQLKKQLNQVYNNNTLV